MINVNTTSSVQIVNQLKRSIANEGEGSPSKSPKKRKSETDTSNNKFGSTDKSTSKSMSSSDIKREPKNKKESNANNQKLMRNKTVSLLDSNKKTRVKFKKDFVQTIQVESYKKYNVDMSYNDSESTETTKCRCSIF